MTVILAFDSSVQNTGYAIGKPSGPVTVGSFETYVPKNNSGTTNYGRVIDVWAEKAWPLIEAADRVYFESPILPFQTKNIDTLRKLYGIAAELQQLALHKRIPSIEVHNQTVKKLIYAHGGSKPENAVEFARAWGFNAKNHDEADACGVFLFALQNKFTNDFNERLTIRRNAPHIERITKGKKPKGSTPRSNKRKRTGKEQSGSLL